MTVQTNNNSIAYVGNGSTVHFDYDYLILDASHLKVYFGDVLQTSGYVVSGVGSQTGGTVAFAVAPPNGTNIVLTREVPFLQLTDYQPYDAFPAESHERALDLLTMMAQQLKDELGRTIQRPVGGNKWDAENNEIINAADGSSDTSVPNVGQVKSLITEFAGPDSAAQLRVDLAAATGSELVGQRLAPGKPATTVALKLRERVTLKDFGGVGNDSADNTATFLDSVSWMIANGRKVIIPEGSFVTDPFAVYALSYSSQIGFVGEDKQRSIIKRLSNGAGAFVTFGNSAQILFCVTNPLANLTVDGGADTNGDTVVTYDLVRGVLDNVKFSGGTHALRMYGGISARVTNYTLELAKIGFKATKYASSVGGAGGGWPNLITLSGGEIVDNKHWGVYFDDGRMLRVRDTDIEGNGSAGFSGGGLYVGPGVGDEVKPGNALSLGVLCDNVWFESNIGVYDFGQDGGYNRLKGCTFHSIGTTNDFAATAGRYKVSECDSTFTKANNFNEGAGVLSGNVVEGSEFPNLTYDANKTEVRGATATNLRNGGIMSANGYAAPRELAGQDNVAAVSNITFNPAFKTGTTPRIYTQVLADDNTASHYSVEVYNITNTGFTMRKKKITSGTATATNYNVMWRAVGEAN